MKREPNETFDQYRARRAEAALNDKVASGGAMVTPGSPLSRDTRRAMLKMSIPHEIDVLISAIAERSSDFTKDELKLIYLCEPDIRKGNAAVRFRKVLEYCEAK